MRLYHGTIMEYAKNIIDNGIIVKYDEAVRGTDFGIGFYTTNNFKLARKCAIIKHYFHSCNPCINSTPVVVHLKYDVAAGREFNVKTFNKCSDDWKKFICANRYENVRNADKSLDWNCNSRYDLVIGAVADSQMSDIRAAIKESNYTLNETILNSILPLKIENSIPSQYSFHNQDLASRITVLKYEMIPLERRC